MPFGFFFDALMMISETQWQPVLVSSKKLDFATCLHTPEAMCLALTLLVAKPAFAADSPASNPTGPV